MIMLKCTRLVVQLSDSIVASTIVNAPDQEIVATIPLLVEDDPILVTSYFSLTSLNPNSQTISHNMFQVLQIF